MRNMVSKQNQEIASYMLLIGCMVSAVGVTKLVQNEAAHLAPNSQGLFVHAAHDLRSFEGKQNRENEHVVEKHSFFPPRQQPTHRKDMPSQHARRCYMHQP